MNDLENFQVLENVPTFPCSYFSETFLKLVPSNFTYTRTNTNKLGTAHVHCACMAQPL